MFFACCFNIGEIILIPFYAIAALIEAISPIFRDRRNAKKAGVSLEEYRSNPLYYIVKGSKKENGRG